MKVRSAFAMQVAAAVLPSIVLLLVVPVVRRHLGLEAFAGFTVLVSSISVLALFDGGLGRATTYFTSKEVARVQAGGEPQNWIWSSMLLGVNFALIVAVVGMVALRMGGGYFKSADLALRVLLASTPAFVLGAILKGALEGQRRFALSTGLQMAYGCGISLAPMALLVGESRLATFSLSVAVIRVLLVMALLLALRGLLASNRGARLATLRSQSKRIFHYTKWLAVSNVVGLCIIFADRFVIARYFDAHTVASYILPMEMISRGQLLIAAFCSVIFPTLVIQAEQRGSRYFDVIKSAQGVIAAAVLAGCCIGLPIAEPLFNWWLGLSLGGLAAQIALISLIGMALITSASVAMVAITSLGHTKQIAGLHAFEIVTYFFLLYIAAHRESLMLLLLAWVARQLIDAFFMSRILRKVTEETSHTRVQVFSIPRVLWTVLIGLYGVYFVLVMKLQVLDIQQRVAIAAVGGAIATGIFSTFFGRLRADLDWARRGAKP